MAYFSAPIDIGWQHPIGARCCRRDAEAIAGPVRRKGLAPNTCCYVRRSGAPDRNRPVFASNRDDSVLSVGRRRTEALRICRGEKTCLAIGTTSVCPRSGCAIRRPVATSQIRTVSSFDAADGRFSVGREGNVLDPLGMRLEGGAQILPGRAANVPHSDGFVVGARYDVAAVRRKSDRVNATGVALDWRARSPERCSRPTAGAYYRSKPKRSEGRPAKRPRC